MQPPSRWDPPGLSISRGGWAEPTQSLPLRRGGSSPSSIPTRPSAARSRTRRRRSRRSRGIRSADAPPSRTLGASASGARTTAPRKGNSPTATGSTRLPDPILAASAGRKFAFINPDATVRRAFQDAPRTISALAWHPLGGCAAVAYFGGVCLWGADDGAAQREFAYGNGIHALARPNPCRFGGEEVRLHQSRRDRPPRVPGRAEI